MTFFRITLAAVVAAFAAVGPAMAQTKTWNFGDQTAPGSCGPVGTPTYGNVVGCTQQPSGNVVDLDVRAYSGTGGTATGNSNPSSGSRTFQTAALNYQGTGSGFGIYNQLEGMSSGSPNHAMDNSTNSGAIDMMLLSFTSAEVLNSVTIGWSGTDGDFQVLAYTGNAPFSTSSIVGKTAAQMLSGGWELVTTVDGAGGINTPDVSYGVNAGNVSSSYWLITAFNSAFGGSGVTSGIDAIKVLAVSSTVRQDIPGVPLPGTVALAGLGLFILARSRRKA
jgi:hypothetical protein